MTIKVFQWLWKPLETKLTCSSWASLNWFKTPFDESTVIFLLTSRSVFNISAWMPYFGFLTPSSKRATSLSLSSSSQPMPAKTGTVAGQRPEIGNDSEVNEWSELLTSEQAKNNYQQSWRKVMAERLSFLITNVYFCLFCSTYFRPSPLTAFAKSVT